jgi:putative hemolysin
MDGTGLTILGLAVVAALLLLNALFVAAEFAYVTVRRTRVEQLAEQGSSPAQRIVRALSNLDFYVAASQLGITMASIALGVFGEPVLASLIEPPIETAVGSFAPALSHVVAISVAFILITSLHIVFGEFVPKTIALQKPEGTALTVASPMDLFVKIFRPAIWLLNASGNAVLRLLGMQVTPIEEETLEVEDLSMTLESSAATGVISRQEMYMTRHVLQLASVSAEDILIPRNELIAIPWDSSRATVLTTFARYRHTRCPVYRDSIDDVVGILDIKDILFLEGDFDWHEYIHEPLFLAENISLERLLEAASATDTVMVILIDEYGGVAGAATIFDAIEFLAGHFPDEFDLGTGPIQRQRDGVVIIDGLVSIIDFEEEFETKLPEGSSHTVGGLVMECLGRVPAVGDRVTFEDYTAEVLEMDEHRVASLRFVPLVRAGSVPEEQA